MITGERDYYNVKNNTGNYIITFTAEKHVLSKKGYVKFTHSPTLAPTTAPTVKSTTLNPTEKPNLNPKILSPNLLILRSQH